MEFRTRVKLLLIASLLTVSSLCAAQEDGSELDTEGMQLIEDTNLALVYAQPGINWAQYSKIYMDEPFVAFKENWQRDQNRDNPGWITDADMEKIKIELSSLFMGVFTEALLEGGYELVLEAGEDVLLIRPAIIGLDVVAPERNSTGLSRTYSESAGEMTLYLELYDSVSGEMLAKALDRKVDRHTGYFEWQNRVTNRAAANRILRVWANILKEGLDDARNSAAQ